MSIDDQLRDLEDRDLMARVAEWRGAIGDKFAPPPGLNDVARTQGLEFATGLFYADTLATPCNSKFAAEVASADAAQVAPPDLVALAPGAFYRDHRHTGADGVRVRRIAQGLGWPAELIPVGSFGRVDDNARTIVDWLLRRPERRIALVSLSKGGSDVKRALAHPRAAEAFAKVVAWVSISGLVQGTPLIAWLRSHRFRWWGVHLLLWYRRQSPRTLHDLRYGPGSLLDPWPTVPPGLRLVHVCGVPLRRHLRHPWAPRAYERLAGLGPNDGGGILLADVAAVPGIVFPVWGADHYLDPSWDAMALLRNVVIAALTPGVRRQAIRSATTPMAAPASRSTA